MKSLLLDKVKTAVRQIEPSAEIILYGSRAREDFHEGSDWDFLILVDGEVDAVRTDRVRHAIYDVELEANEVLSSIIKSRQEWQSPKFRIIPLHENVDREGITI
jgi:predicted nucleotidyltransferase